MGSIRMAHDETEMLRTVIRTASGGKEVTVTAVNRNYTSEVHIAIKVDTTWEKHKFKSEVPDVGAVPDAAAAMLMFMELEKYPMRVATFMDYIDMAYELGKQYRSR